MITPMSEIHKVIYLFGFYRNSVPRKLLAATDGCIGNSVSYFTIHIKSMGPLRSTEHLNLSFPLSFYENTDSPIALLLASHTRLNHAYVNPVVSLTGSQRLISIFYVTYIFEISRPCRNPDRPWFLPLSVYSYWWCDRINRQQGGMTGLSRYRCSHKLYLKCLYTWLW